MKLRLSSLPLLALLIALIGLALVSVEAGFAQSGLLHIIYLPIIRQGVKGDSGYDWLQYGGDAQHSGVNPVETTLGPANVDSLTLRYRVQLPDVADGSPAFLRGVATANGARDLLFVTTRDGTAAAVDASTGVQVWAQQVPAGACRINQTGGPCYTTSSPAVDPNRKYVYSYGLDGAVHKYQVGDGVEIKTGGWPEVATLKAFDEKGSSSLAVATDRSGASYLYVASSGYPGDNGDYQGHVTVIDLATGAQHVFNALCSGQALHFVEKPGTPDCAEVQTGIWSRPPVVYAAGADRVYIATGNGAFSPADGHWGNTVLSLHPNGTGNGSSPLDSYTPANFAQLSAGDVDLGSTAPAILPAVPGSKIAHLGVQGGKDGLLRLLDLDNLSGQSGVGHTGGEVATLAMPQGGGLFGQPAVWKNPRDGSVWVFVANGNGLAGLQVTAGSSGVPGLTTQWKVSDGGTSPVVANGVLYVAGAAGIRAVDALTGKLLWSDPQVGSIHWESPIVAGGALYITDENGNLSAYVLGQ